MSSAARFPIRFDSWYRVLSSILAVFPSDSYVEVDGETVRARMAWAFRTSFPRSAVTGSRRLESRPFSRGVHGVSGRWLVNGSGDRILAIDLAPPQSARVLGVPIELRQLLVSVDDPDALAERLRVT